MRSLQDLQKSMCAEKHDWQTKRYESIGLYTVIAFMFEYDFIVEIEGNMYDVKFAYNKKAKEVSYCYSIAPSPHLISFEFIEKAFRIGKWYKVLKREDD